MIGTLAHRQPHHLAASLLLEHVLGYLLGLHLPQAVGRFLLGAREGHPGRFKQFFDSNFGVALFLLRLVGLLFLLLGFELDFCEGVAVVGRKVLVVEVAFLAVFAYFVEVVHVELSETGGTCLTKEE